MQHQNPTVMCLALGLAAATVGCPNEELAPLQPCTVSGVVQSVRQTAVDKVDLLFVIDDSRSMEQEQTALRNELPRMVRILASGDFDDCGARTDCTDAERELDFPPVVDMHLGVISTDMGANGQDTNLTDKLNCEDPGRDGLLLNGVSAKAECGGVSVPGKFLSFSTGESVNNLGTAFSCIADLGITGCGQEMQLEAMLKAVTASTSEVKFYETGSPTATGSGHSDGANNGFLREEAVLAVIIVTDEDDCSPPVESSELLCKFDTMPPPGGCAFASEPLNLRCGNHPELLYPPERYRDGLWALKPSNPELVIFAAIAGIPLDLQNKPATEILQDSRMEFRADRPATEPSAQPVPSCQFDNPLNAAVPQDAFPPNRIVQAAELFGENGTVQSICQSSFTGALDNIIQKISAQLKGACLPRELTRSRRPDADGNPVGLVTCDIVEVMMDINNEGDALCNTPGRRPERVETGVDATGNQVNFQVCKVNQVGIKLDMDTSACTSNPASCLAVNPDEDRVSDDLVGWYYDNFSLEVLDTCGDAPQRITFTENAQSPQGALVRFECLQPVLAFGESPKGVNSIGLSCEGNSGACEAATCSDADVSSAVVGCDLPYNVTCEGFTNTCQVTCLSQANCPNGYQCDKTGDEPGLCILPTCPALER